MTTLALPSPTPGLIATINARTWLDYTIDGRVFSPVLLTYPAPQFEDADPVEVERQMSIVAASLGARPPGPALPDVGERVTVHDGGVTLVHFDGSPYALRLPKHPRWTQVVAGLGQVLLAVGLDELSSTASRAEVDEYLDAAAAGDRLYFGLATVTSQRRSTQRRP